MADPVIPRGIRAQLIMHGRSGLPEDRFVTTWAFLRNTDQSYADSAQAVADRLAAFISNTGANAQSLEMFLSPAVLRGADALEVRTYDLANGVPRAPTVFTYDINTGAPTGGLPAEVAVCGSFYAERNLPRQRGRVYFGPLGTSASAVDNNGRIVASPAIRDTLAAALEALKLGNEGPNQPLWCVLSQADATMRMVTEGWVDDAFDTQRRRGEAPQQRVMWGQVIP